MDYCLKVKEKFSAVDDIEAKQRAKKIAEVLGRFGIEVKLLRLDGKSEPVPVNLSHDNKSR